MNLKMIAIKNGATLPPSIFEFSDITMMLNFLLPGNVKVKIAIDDIRLRSTLATEKTITFSERSFFFTTIGFTQSHSCLLNEIPRDTLTTFREPIRVKDLLTRPELINFFNAIVFMDLLLIVPQNIFFVNLTLIRLRDMKYLRNLELNLLIE